MDLDREDALLLIEKLDVKPPFSYCKSELYLHLSTIAVCKEYVSLLLKFISLAYTPDVGDLI